MLLSRSVGIFLGNRDFFCVIRGKVILNFKRLGTLSVMPTVSSKWNVGFQAQEQLRTVLLLLLTEWKAANNRPVHFIKKALRKCFRERANFRR
jgi:hypothetical protein